MQRLSGSDLRTRRIRLGLSRERIAHAVGVPTATVIEWEDEAVPISCPRAVEQLLRQGESESAAALRYAS